MSFTDSLSPFFNYPVVLQQDKVDTELRDLRKRHSSLTSEATRFTRAKAAAEAAAAAAEQRARDVVGGTIAS